MSARITTANRESKLVYAIVCPSQGTIKIGASDHPLRRLGDLLTASSAWMFLWATWEGGFDEESKAHAALSTHHVRGEWFCAHPDVIEYVLGKVRPDWACAVRKDYRYAGAILALFCFEAALEDEEQNEDSPNYGLHKHKPCAVDCEAARHLPTIPRLRRGCRHVPGNLVPEQWLNDIGSPYWQLVTPIEGTPERERPPKPEAEPSAESRQPSLFAPRGLP